MAQARARTIQKLKSLNHFYKVCSGTNTSRSYSSVSSFKALYSVKKFSSFSSAAEPSDFINPNQFPASFKYSSGYGNYSLFRESSRHFDQNPDGGYGENYMGVQNNPTGAYGQSYNYNSNHQNNILNHNSNTLYEEYTNVQSSYTIKSGVSKEVTGDGDYQYPKNNVTVQESPGNYNMVENGLHLQSQYNVNGSYSGYHQQISGTNYQISNGDYILVTIEVFDAYLKDRKVKEAVEVLGLLEQNNILVDMPRYLFLMKLCGEFQALQEAKLVHYHLTRSIPHIDVFIWNKIIEMYSKCGSMEDAYKVFDKMPQRNLTSWDTIITWFAKNGHGEDAIDMFTEFKKVGLKPDHQMFLGVFNACSVVGDMREGLLHFESMRKTYNLVPSIDHYVGVVNMLASSGYLNEALEFIENMPIKPSVEIWEIMMIKSSIHGDLELADRCADIIHFLDLSRLDVQLKEGLIPINPSEEKEENDKEKEKTKLLRINPLSFKGRFCEYRAGDTSHPNHKNVYGQLRCLRESMIEAGYVPNTKFALHDVDEESREENLFAHSERLALSQALLTSSPRAPVRIIKNLRACVDCHNALKIISKLVGRKIIARDAKRFHHFENGECSCGDYW